MIRRMSRSDAIFRPCRRCSHRGIHSRRSQKSYQFLVELGNHVAEILTKQTTPEQGLQAADDAFTKALKDAGYL